MKLARIFAVIFALCFIVVAAASASMVSLANQLPQIIKVEDYKPLLKSVSKEVSRRQIVTDSDYIVYVDESGDHGLASRQLAGLASHGQGASRSTTHSPPGSRR